MVARNWGDISGASVGPSGPTVIYPQFFIDNGPTFGRAESDGSNTGNIGIPVIVTNGGTGTSVQFNQGSLVFAGVGGVYNQDNANLFWDDTNNRLGIGTTTPGARLEVAGGEIVGAPAPPSGGLLAGDLNAQRLLINGVPLSSTATATTVLNVPTNAALKALVTPMTGVTVLREGFNAPGDGGAMIYNYSSAACTLHGGAGDNGCEVRPNSGPGSWVWTMPPIAHVKVWGGGLGGADDSVPFQDMINAAQTQHFAARFSGNCTKTGTLHITAPVDFGGLTISDGLRNTTNTPVIALDTVDYINLHDFSAGYSGTTSTSATITMTNTQGYCRFTNVGIDGYDGIVGTNMLTCVFDKMYISTTHIGISIANTGDSGDNRISNSLITGSSTTTGIVLTSGGGLTILNNKIITHSVGVALAANTTGGSFSDLFVFNNSIETCAEAGVKLTRIAGAGGFGNVMVNNNQFADSRRAVYVPIDPTGPWVTGLTIVDNVWGGVGTVAGTYAEINSVHSLYAVGGAAASFFPGSRLFSIGGNVTGGYFGLVTPNTDISTFVADINAGINVYRVGQDPAGTLTIHLANNTNIATTYQNSVPQIASLTDAANSYLSLYIDAIDLALNNKSGGKVLIGTGTIPSLLTVNGACSNVSGAWTTISDREMKQNIEPYTRGLAAVVELNPVMFRYRAGAPFSRSADDPSDPLLGLIADEVEPHVPEIVGETTASGIGEDKGGVSFSTLEPGNLIYAVINSIKELSARLEAVEAKL